MTAAGEGAKEAKVEVKDEVKAEAGNDDAVLGANNGKSAKVASKSGSKEVTKAPSHRAHGGGNAAPWMKDSKAHKDAMKEQKEREVPPVTSVTAEGVTLPMDIGTRVMCRWRDAQLYPVRVIERRMGQSGPAPEEYEYYVHYEQFNRRLDTWVMIGEMDMTSVEAEEYGPDGKKKRKASDDHAHDEEHAEFDPNALREHEEVTKVRNILTVELGKHAMDTWYFSPFPPEYTHCKKLYFCEFTLNFFKRKEQLQRHLRKNELYHPPGDEIYRNEIKGRTCSFFEVDGKKEKMFCQNLCYIAKLFLDHKTLYYDVDLFLFYILCEVDERGYHIVGYFSKEKCSEEGYNLACILTLPAYQRKGYGKMLISFSYELSKKEGKVGTPERPLSDLGLVSYRGYWTRELLNILQDPSRTVMSIKDLSDLTCIKTEDIISTLQHLNLLAYQKGAYVICAAPEIITKHLKAAGSPGVVVDPGKLIWTPYNAEKDYKM
eukprot:CAMPEP_0197575486 /NCGR_PEP_ID=MMETSP1326-20131121/866_1 /TAXON_ID=1155430 /ORGANISM="Genus nov. species nov., Strain RCC2288" /LENGTH=487 /DNA_ID=CAMNT_0043138263 /DNA_START=129 /DNA_END=1592 /DNA_ORIENTATION=-